MVTDVPRPSLQQTSGGMSQSRSLYVMSQLMKWTQYFADLMDTGPVMSDSGSGDQERGRGLCVVTCELWMIGQCFV